MYLLEAFKTVDCLHSFNERVCSLEANERPEKDIIIQFNCTSKFLTHSRRRSA